MRVILTFLNGPLRGKQSVFKQPGRYLVGRGVGCDLHLPANEQFALISRRHCLLELLSNTVRVCDLRSCNGTFVNGVRLSNSECIQFQAVTRNCPRYGFEFDARRTWRYLHDGDELCIGGVYLRVTFDALAEAT